MSGLEAEFAVGPAREALAVMGLALVTEVAEALVRPLMAPLVGLVGLPRGLGVLRRGLGALQKGITFWVQPPPVACPGAKILGSGAELSGLGAELLGSGSAL